MKPSPMPLFNYRKRERHALVSDPQKTSNPDGIVSDDSAQGVPQSSSSSNASAPSSSHGNRFQGQSSSAWKDFKNPNTNTTPNSHATYNNKTNRPQPSYSSSSATCSSSNKPTPSFIKTPALLNHKAGVNNRRTTVNEHQAPNSNTTSHQQFDNRNNFGPYSANQNISGKRSNPNYNDNMQGKSLEQSWNKNNAYNKHGSTPLFHSNINEGSNFTSNSNPRFSGQSLNPRANSSTTSSSSSNSNQWNNQSLSGSGTYNKINNSNANNTNSNSNRPNVVKLQSGNVQTQFGMARHNNQRFQGNNPNQSTSFGSSNPNTNSGQFSGNANAAMSIFDAEDVVQPSSSKYQKESPAELDTSLRIFTCPIRDIQSWSAAGLYDGSAMFEVYGLIISGTSDTDLGVGKEFYVRDQSGTIRCVFYEIDREMPPVMKGQVHRLLGSMVKKPGGSYLHVVSLRKADKEERSSCQQATELSLNEMDKLARRLGREQ